jgi:pyruvate/2-oxoglutarate/acetoin dehydrogenase E1 component/TPP-dependent pyruvate/acetoin dehydrogenase alpha subunit
MTERPAVEPDATVEARLGAFVVERHPFAAAALGAALASLDPVLPDTPSVARLRAELPPALRRELRSPPADLPECTPAVAAASRWQAAVDELVDACDGFLHRLELRWSLSREERREILRGMTLTRATDNRLKSLFTGGEVRYRETTFQGKGFRSLGQEAIYASVIRLRRGDAYRTPEGWRGDVIAPIIRDLGAELAMSIPSPGGAGPDRTAEMVRMALSAQMGKAGPPMNGRDLHVGDMSRGILPAAAPLATGALTLTGMALAFAQQGDGRVAITYMGEGATSLGEWHEAINFSAVRRLPIVFCVQNNQTALSTPIAEQSAARVFADKAAGYGLSAVTLDGTDPDEIAAAFAWAVERARGGGGPTLIELVSMRMCGHAHHDDMLYLGKDPQPSWSYPSPTDAGYADQALYAYWRARDPLVAYAARLEADGAIDAGEAQGFRDAAQAFVEREARAVIAAPWPDAATAGEGVFAGEPPRTRIDVLEPSFRSAVLHDPPLPPLEANPPHDPRGRTFLDAVMLGIGDALRADPRVFVIGEDVGGAYGNAFLLLRPLLQEFGPRILNAPIAESAVIGACVGAALAGQRPIGEMQFNDFVATGFNQLVNNAAKIRYRWGGEVPMVLRMPWGGLRHAGPYHSQNTEAWFYRTPGLKIVVPSTPADARAAMAAAVADPDPVLYYEHIALYRDPRIRQALEAAPPEPLATGKAALRRAGSDLAIVSYGAYVHTALAVAEALAADGVQASVLDLRWLAPLDKDALLAVARHCSRVLIVHEDTRTGGVGESLAAIVQEEAFESLDAPVRIVGALDTPVPYSPPLEDAFLPSEAEIERAARRLLAY